MTVLKLPNEEEVDDADEDVEREFGREDQPRALRKAVSKDGVEGFGEGSVTLAGASVEVDPEESHDGVGDDGTGVAIL